jgi:hypothetical protein
MRVIDVSKPGKHQRITALSYGASRSGKTRFAGSWPRPLFLSDATESGWTTLQNMDKSILFEEGRDPKVWAIEKMIDMTKAVKDAEPLIKRGEVRTIVIDSLTFYSDLVFNFFESAGGERDPRRLYQKLAAHLKTLREEIHLLGCNVVWLCLAKDPGEEQPVGGPMLSGQNAQKFSAGCDYLLYHRHFQSGNGPLQWEVRTRKFGSYAAGGRDEGRLPDPLGYITEGADNKDVFIPECTYRTLAEALGILDPLERVEDLFDLPPETPVSLPSETAQPVAAATPEPSVVAPATATPDPTPTPNNRGKAPVRPQTAAQSGRPSSR